MYFLFSREQLAQGIITVWRFVLLIITAAILTFSTSVSQLVYAIEKLFKPLKLVGISPRNIAVMVSTTIRFIPLLFLETNNIRDAQKSRGANLKKIKHIIGLINALLRRTFGRASNLADAMESRCYRDYGYSHLRELKISAKDILSVLFTALILGGVLWI
jgi:energy-coupling factor transport system permease protein|tara:strand:+ start:491 stop:970 length:480 start_codon:yes stop_codon:yes gene_type:complete